ncbi:MAG: serine/threonine protein kinase, partial [Proteobacteria bacterium]|nr:serine/threonine protein kinase [Pseudomonadota bacterium]
MQLDVGRQIDRYTLEAPIGAGGQGFVYRMRHIQLGTAHALKVVTGAGPRVRERLLQEGRAQARLRHPNIVTVTDVLEVDGDPGLIMEFISGPPLSHLLAENALTVAQADLLVSGILDGVAHAHGLRFIHRDLKPDNILCAVTQRGLVPKIMDFGLVKALDGGTGDTGVRATRSGAMMGTAHYMSPEQIRSTKHVDERSDIWALGVIFYEMLTGTVPFDGSDTFEIFASVTTGAYRPLNELRPELPERMVKAVEAALIIDVDERVASVEKLRALWLGVEHVPAAPHEGRTSSGAWDPTMLDKYATTSQPFSEPSGSMNTWVEPSGKAKTSGHTLTPGMGVDGPSESSSNKGPWIVLALGAA